MRTDTSSQNILDVTTNLEGGPQQQVSFDGHFPSPCCELVSQPLILLHLVQCLPRQLPILMAFAMDLTLAGHSVVKLLGEEHSPGEKKMEPPGEGM